MEKIPDLNYVTLDNLLERSSNRDLVSLCLSADIALGGGIPFGCTIVMAGREKTGKTTTALQIAAEAQKQYPGTQVEYYNKERRLTSKVLGQIRGLDKDYFISVEPAEKRNKAKELIGYDTWSSETWLEHLGESIASSKRKIMIFDSLSSLASEKQLSESVGYQDRGASKKVETHFYQKYGDLVIPNEHILIFIAQGYSNTSGYGKNFVIKAGSSVKYQADLIACVNKVEKWKPTGDNQKILGHDALFEISESPLGPPDELMRIPIRYGFGLDKERDAVSLGIEWGIIHKATSWYNFPFKEDGTEIGEKEEGHKVQGEVRARNFLVANDWALEKIEVAIREIAFPGSTTEKEKEKKKNVSKKKKPKS